MALQLIMGDCELMQVEEADSVCLNLRCVICDKVSSDEMERMPVYSF